MSLRYIYTPLERPTVRQGLVCLKELNHGSDGSVYLCQRSSDGMLLVVKYYNQLFEPGQLPREIDMLGNVLPPHPLVVYLENYIHWPDGELQANFHYCEGGDLAAYYSGPHGEHARSEGFIWHVFVQMAEALVFLRKSTISQFLVEP